MAGEIERIAAALERIATALELVVGSFVEVEPDQVPECQHPPDNRLDFGVTQGQADWQCSLCGHRSIEE